MSLPTVFSWPLVIPPISAPGSVSSGSPLAAGAGISSPNPSYMTEADLLAVLDRILPDWYLDPMKLVGPGYEIFQAWAKCLERVSLAVGRAECAMFIIYSHGGARSTATVEFYRSSSTNGAFTVKAGAICRTSKTNRSFVVMADIVFGSLDLVVQGQVQAIAPGAEYNVLGPASCADGTVLPGEIDTIVIPLLSPVYAEPTLQVRQVADASGGQAAALDQLGLDRNLPRLPNETDESYKGRIRSLPDTVSPDALNRQLTAVFAVLGLSYTLIETWQNEYMTSWDEPDTDVVSTTMGVAHHDCFYFDDTRTDPFRGRWMSEEDCPAGLVLVAPNVVAWADRSFWYDDTSTVGPESSYATLLVNNLTHAIVTSGAIWSAILSVVVTGEIGNTVTFSIGFNTGPKQIEVRDRQRWDAGTSTWTSNDANVGVRVQSQAGVDLVKLVEIEAAINATSGIIRVSTPTPNPNDTIDFAALNATTADGGFSEGVSDQETALGWRATSAYDVPDADLVDHAHHFFVRTPFYDGYDALKQLFYLRLFDLLKQIKGGGIHHVIELKGQ